MAVHESISEHLEDREKPKTMEMRLKKLTFRKHDEGQGSTNNGNFSTLVKVLSTKL